MSTFGDDFVRVRNEVETWALAFLKALEPAVKAVAVTAISNGVSAFSATTGSIGDRGVAARNAVEQTVQSAAPALTTDALHAAVGLLTSPAP